MHFYRTGLKVPKCGIYKVSHSKHRLPHEVTLLQGEIFPRCSHCGDLVQFELIRTVGRIDDKFRVVLYELPEAA